MPIPGIARSVHPIAVSQTRLRPPQLDVPDTVGLLGNRYSRGLQILVTIISSDYELITCPYDVPRLGSDSTHVLTRFLLQPTRVTISNSSRLRKNYFFHDFA